MGPTDGGYWCAHVNLAILQQRMVYEVPQYRMCTTSSSGQGELCGEEPVAPTWMQQSQTVGRSLWTATHGVEAWSGISDDLGFDATENLTDSFMECLEGPTSDMYDPQDELPPLSPGPFTSPSGLVELMQARLIRWPYMLSLR